MESREKYTHKCIHILDVNPMVGENLSVHFRLYKYIYRKSEQENEKKKKLLERVRERKIRTR